VHFCDIDTDVLEDELYMAPQVPPALADLPEGLCYPEGSVGVS